MNIRSLTRGDGVVIGAAVVLFIASFLSQISVDCGGANCQTFNAWDSLGRLMSIYIAGIIGAVLIVVARAMPGRKVVNLDLGQFGVALTVFALWTAFWTIIDTTSAGAGMILGLLATIALAAGAVASPMVPALKAPLVSGAPKPGVGAAPQPYGAQPGAQPGGYGYPGATGAPAAAYGADGTAGGGGYGYPGGAAAPADPNASQGGAPQAAGQPQAAAPAGDFQPFWFAVPVQRPLYAEDGSPTPVADLTPGNWYLAVEQRGTALVAQTQDGRRGILQDTTGIQRG